MSLDFMAIDPGLKGYIVVFADGTPVVSYPLATAYAATSPYKALYNFILSHGGGGVAVLEDVHAILGDSSRSAYTFGFNNGILEAALTAGAQHISKVSPMRWMWKMHKGLPKSTATKKRSMAAARMMYPEFTAPFPDSHDGLFDALLIGAWYMYYGGTTE